MHNLDVVGGEMYIEPSTRYSLGVMWFSIVETNYVLLYSLHQWTLPY